MIPNSHPIAVLVLVDGLDAVLAIRFTVPIQKRTSSCSHDIVRRPIDGITPDFARVGRVGQFDPAQISILKRDGFDFGLPSIGNLFVR